MPQTDWHDYFKSQQQTLIDLLTALINYESPTNNKAAVDQLGVFLTQQFHALGASSVQRFPQEQVGDTLLAKWNENAPGKPILAMVHFDTVCPIGSLAERPVRISDGKLFGPGSVDMKAGITAVLGAIRALNERGLMPNRPIWLLATTDEEIGSGYSEPIIIEAALQAGLVLVMEPATPSGALKTWRKGIGTYFVRATGRASHAGSQPEQGINAIIELAQQALRLHTLNDLRNGTSVSVTMISGGTATNVIPAHAEIAVDVRTLTSEAWNRVQEAIMNVETYVPGAQVTVQLDHARPPMEYNDTMKRTAAQVKQIGTALGITLREEGSGGGSDGNITANLGIPTLDGLGPTGDGAHATHEHVLLSSLPEHTALIAGIFERWVLED